MNLINIILFYKKRAKFFNLSIPVYVFYLIAGFLVLLVPLTIYFVIATSHYAYTHRKVQTLNRENQLLKTEIATVRTQLETLSLKLQALAELDAQIRIAANLELLPKDVRKMGYGGSNEGDIIAEVDNLIERARQQEKSFQQLKSYLQQQSALLRHTPSIWPVAGWLSSGFGYRKSPWSGKSEFHEGIDIVAPAGTPILATADGRVQSAGYKPGWGRYVEIDHGFGYVTFYGHCQSIRVRTGQKVNRGDTIATVGRSGSATGNHLHYGIKVAGSWVNPLNYILTESASR
ncbi:MAG: peptidoglycan DD-metalloendopeptidase family protein [candidate division WOR-3 bacterium]|nr:peptidoglycan DD-metalloendopeptidase family protein [candidate division WOR-3 bacterium]